MDMDMGMDMPFGTNMTMMMIPYLHFGGGDTLFFSKLVPSSPGAIAGACIILFFISVLERLAAAIVRFGELKARNQ
jgi:copper transporter 1